MFQKLLGHSSVLCTVEEIYSCCLKSIFAIPSETKLFIGAPQKQKQKQKTTTTTNKQTLKKDACIKFVSDKY